MKGKPLTHYALSPPVYFDVGPACAYAASFPPPGSQDRTEHLPGETVVLEEDNESLYTNNHAPLLPLYYRAGPDGK